MELEQQQEQLIEQLYQAMYCQLLDYAYCAINDRALAEEAVQDTFRIACAKAAELSASANPPGWLMNTLKNSIRNIRRSRARDARLQLQLLTRCSKDKAAADETEALAALQTDIDCQQAIGAENYELIKKVVLQRYTLLEVAQELGISAEACKKRVQRAKSQLEKYFEKK